MVSQHMFIVANSDDHINTSLDLQDFSKIRLCLYYITPELSEGPKGLDEQKYERQMLVWVMSST